MLLLMLAVPWLMPAVPWPTLAVPWPTLLASESDFQKCLEPKDTTLNSGLESGFGTVVLMLAASATGHHHSGNRFSRTCFRS